MKEEREQLEQLLNNEELSLADKEWLLNYIDNTDQEELTNMLKAGFEADLNDSEPLNAFVSRKMLVKIHQKLDLKKESERGIKQIWIRIAAAASVIAILGYGAFLYTHKNKADNIVQNHRTHLFKNDVGPVAERAILALGDGSKLMLDKVKNGTVINQGKTKVVKTDGKLAYNAVKNNAETAFNTLTTPRGGHYRVELPDGTQVWLNAASSIRYPTAFTADTRTVEITGEAYFEVTKNKKMPFIVKVNSTEVRVYGTHFNVMAYNDEKAVKTTLLEGSVKCINGKTSCMLKPGEQSELEKDGQYKVSANVDVSDAVAWKNGLFHFENADIESVMRQISRAYNVDIIYNKKPTDHFIEEIPLNSPLSEVLKVLELTGKVHFDIQGKQVIVSP